MSRSTQLDRPDPGGASIVRCSARIRPMAVRSPSSASGPVRPVAARNVGQVARPRVGMVEPNDPAPPGRVERRRADGHMFEVKDDQPVVIGDDHVDRHEIAVDHARVPWDLASRDLLDADREDPVRPRIEGLADQADPMLGGLGETRGRGPGAVQRQRTSTHGRQPGDLRRQRPHGCRKAWPFDWITDQACAQRPHRTTD